MNNKSPDKKKCSRSWNGSDGVNSQSLNDTLFTANKAKPANKYRSVSKDHKKTGESRRKIDNLMEQRRLNKELDQWTTT